MQRLEQIRIAKRLLDHISAGTTDTAPAQHIVPVTSYQDTALWEREVDTFYRNLPIIAGLSCELPGPGSYLTATIVGIPVLLTRDNAGALHAFLNVCRHRSALVAKESCKGHAKRFSCHYHGWTYDNLGRLVGVPGAESFGPFDHARHGLTKIYADERAGLIYVCLRPGMTFHLDDWLAGIDRHMAPHNVGGFHHVGTRTVRAANWKLVMEGHLESYHFSTLHRNSIGPFMINNCATIDRFGPHQLITFAQKSIISLRDLPEDDWHPLTDGHINPQYILFPGTTVTLFKDSALAQIIRPGISVGSSTNTLVSCHRLDPDEHADVKLRETESLDAVVRLVRDEDYAAGLDIQRGLASGAQDNIIFGRNEPGLTYFHEAIHRQFSQD